MVGMNLRGALLFSIIVGTSLAFLSFNKRGGNASKSTCVAASPKDRANELIKANKVMVFSKTYCPYCTKAKNEIAKLAPTYGVLELDNDKEGDAIQAALLEITGQVRVRHAAPKHHSITPYPSCSVVPRPPTTTASGLSRTSSLEVSMSVAATTRWPP